MAASRQLSIILGAKHQLFEFYIGMVCRLYVTPHRAVFGDFVAELSKVPLVFF
jgi:hypothetical protein